MRYASKKRGFTLIELSIVLVIIGLIVGGVLTGQDMIHAAEVRAQITQIEKYNSAVNTFHSKFNAIPGDMRPEIASQFGFTVGTGCTGGAAFRDGNGLIDGSATYFVKQAQLETGMFWVDLSSNAAGGLIDGAFPSGGGVIGCINPPVAIVATTLGNYIPAAKIGHGNFIYVYEYSGSNWYGLSSVSGIDNLGASTSTGNISVSQAYNIDKKVDDGLPVSGNIQAAYVSYYTNAYGPISASNTPTSGGNSTSCYDTTTGTYSITVNNGTGGNCGISFKFQ